MEGSSIMTVTGSKTKGLIAVVAAAVLAIVPSRLLGRFVAEERARRLREVRKNAAADNFNMAGNIDLSMGLLGIQLPMDMKVNLDVAKGNMHGTIGAEDDSTSMEIYSITAGADDQLHQGAFRLTWSSSVFLSGTG